MGIPVGNYGTSVNSARHVNLLPFRAYQLIWNEYYRDPTLQDPYDFSKASGEFGITANADLALLRQRCWEKDYFTSALPFTQRGSEVLLPLSGNAPVSGQFNYDVGDGHGIFLDSDVVSDVIAAGGQGSGRLTSLDGSGHTVVFDKVTPAPGGDPLSADLTEASATTINELRRAFSLQRWLERNARWWLS